MVFLLSACGEEKVYTKADFNNDPGLVDKVINANGRSPSDITAHNLKNAKAWFPEKFGGRKSNFSGIFKNSEQK